MKINHVDEVLGFVHSCHWGNQPVKNNQKMDLHQRYDLALNMNMHLGTTFVLQQSTCNRIIPLGGKQNKKNSLAVVWGAEYVYNSIRAF